MIATLVRALMLGLEAAAVLVIPIALGMGIGSRLRSANGSRFRGIAALIACVIVPAALVTVVTIYFPIIGLWDGVTEGLLCGAGVAWAAHSVFADSRNVVLAATSAAAALVLLEIGVRLFLGQPPAYPIGDGPHFLFSTLLRTTGPDSPMFQQGAMPYFLEKQAMDGDPRAGTMEARPPSAMVTKEIVCSIVYGPAYAGVIDVSRDRAEVFPDTVSSRSGASRRVLHVGDSMVYGANVQRNETFTVDLEALEPEVQHLNGGISGMAPDDYFAVIRSWVARTSVDLVVMYLFAGNDVVGMDAPHPCSDWQSILVYEGGSASLRFPSAPKSDPRVGLRWLVVNSPLPFLGRVMIVAGSHLAAFSGAVLDAWAVQDAQAHGQEQLEHLEAILRTARDELREKNIAFVVVVLPHADAIGIPGGPSDHLSSLASAIAKKLDIPLLDASGVVGAALKRGENPIQPDRSHFNKEGHWLMAKWLHEHLAAAADLKN